MIRFGHFYIGNRFVVYDLAAELVLEQPRWVATLSENPAIHFDGVDPDEAVAALRRYVEQMQAFNAMQAA